MNQADEAWVQKLYRYNAPKLYKVVLRRLEDAEAAQDIVQEAFLALIEKIELVKCPQSCWVADEGSPLFDSTNN